MSGSDPLAELARLIGQTDPFAEYERTSRAPPQRTVPRSVTDVPADMQTRPPLASPGGLGQASFPPLQGYYQDQDQRTAFDHAAYHEDDLGGAVADHYDDVPPTRHIGVIAIAGVFAMVVLGTAAALGYRALFGSSGSSPPPVIKAETAPSKVVPPITASNAANNKLINDRIGDNAQLEKLVSREEQPLDLKEKIQSAAPNARPVATSVTSAVSTEPKKVKTIAIRPDQPTTAAVETPPVPTSTPGRAAPSARTTSAPIPLNAESDNVPPARSAPPVRNVPVRAAANGPLSLNPDAGPVATKPARAAPARVAALAAANGGGSGNYAVQVSAQRSEADAQAAFRSLQERYPAQLNGRQAVIRRADLGSKGVYYRAMVGPFASASEASELCNNLKAAGGQCLIQKN